jgi:hypothetical protein
VEFSENENPSPLVLDEGVGLLANENPPPMLLGVTAGFSENKNPPVLFAGAGVGLDFSKNPTANPELEAVVGFVLVVFDAALVLDFSTFLTTSASPSSVNPFRVSTAFSSSMTTHLDASVRLSGTKILTAVSAAAATKCNKVILCVSSRLFFNPSKEPEK